MNNACLVDVVARGAWEIPLMAQPATLNLHLKAALNDRVPRELGKRALRELVYLAQAVSGIESCKRTYTHELLRCTPPTAVPGDF
jgi:hypothetical protein